jgi:hypothetical protein
MGQGLDKKWEGEVMKWTKNRRWEKRRKNRGRNVKKKGDGTRGREEILQGGRRIRNRREERRNGRIV